MTRRFSSVIAFVMLVFALGSMVQAHHSTAAYEAKTITLKNAIATKLVWANPHSVVWFEVKDGRGRVTTWARREWQPLRALSRGLEPQFSEGRGCHHRRALSREERRARRPSGEDRVRRRTGTAWTASSRRRRLTPFRRNSVWLAAGTVALLGTSHAALPRSSGGCAGRTG